MRKYNRAMFAKAIFFASYYNRRCEDYYQYVGRFFMRDTRKDLEKFESVWRQKQVDSGFDEEFWERMQDLKYYKKALKKGRAGSDDKIQSILAHKQFFSVPWLVCFKDLI